MKQPIIIHTEEDFDRAQRRVAELQAQQGDGREKQEELEAIADAMLAFEMRRDEPED